MFFRPNFCANCGEKIERADWGIFTSRRFCPVCESEFKGNDLIPRAIVAVGVVIGILGLGSYLQKGTNVPNSLAVRQPAKIMEQKLAEAPVVQQPVKTDTVSPLATMNLPQTPTAQPASKQEPKLPTTAEEPLYFCGAETKKGTPCTRRVKGNTRCYQHKGLPAMLPPEKLRAG